MSRVSALRISIVALAVLVAATPIVSRAANASLLRSNTPAPTSNIVIGFVGGFVSHDNPHHGPVQLAQRIRQTVPKGTYVRVFENRRRKRAYDDVLRLLDVNHDGVLSPKKKLVLTSFSSATVGEPPQPCCWRATCAAAAYRFY